MDRSFEKLIKYIFVFLAILSMSACAHHYTHATNSDPYGFFSGLLHGFVFPFALITNIISWTISLIGIDLLEEIQIIGRPNTGFIFYYVGFFFGLLPWGGSEAK